MLIFETKRTNVRQITPSDFDGFYDLQSNPKVMEMIPAPIMSAAEAKSDIERLIKEYNTEFPNRVMDIWVVEEKSSKAFIGTCGLLYKTPFLQKQSIPTVEIGYRFREQFWKNGFGNEVCKGLIDYTFHHTDFLKIIADVSKSNLGSVKILQNNMTFIGESYNEEDQCQDLHFELLKSTI